jgi:predicted transcriptional regulator
MFAKDITSNDCQPVKLNTRVEIIHEIFSTQPAKELPVIDEKGLYIGIISHAHFLTLNNTLETLENSLVPFSTIHIAPDQHIYEAFKSMTINDINILPVVDNKNVYIGSIDRKTLDKQILDILCLTQNGAILTIRSREENILMSQICNIIESNGAKILSLYSSNTKDDFVEIVIKINEFDVTSIIQSFNRFGYIVETYNGITESLNSLIKQRLDNLMNFINM